MTTMYNMDLDWLHEAAPDTYRSSIYDPRNTERHMTTSISRRPFNGLMVSTAAAVGLGVGKALSKASETGDVDWTSDDPHLSGNYLPVAREFDAANLSLISGRIPRDLSGAYMRNGPNPLFKPIYYAYPMD